MSAPFWLAVFASSLAHIAATATLIIYIETDQTTETQNLTVEVMNEQFVRAASVATALTQPRALKNSQILTQEPTPLVEVQPIPHWESELFNGLTSVATGTKPPSKLAETEPTVSLALPPPTLEQNAVRRSIERPFKTTQFSNENNIPQAKTHLPPTLSTVTSVVPSILSSTHHETSAPFSVTAPGQFDENTLQNPEPESVGDPQTKMAPSQGPTPLQYLRPMPSPPRASVPRRSQSIIPPLPTQTISQPTVSSEFDATDPSTAHSVLSAHVHTSKQQGSKADYKNPALGNKPPEYPRRARRQGLEGRVVVGVSVSNQGDPREVFIRESSGVEIFDDAAITAIKEWRFLPATRGGTPIDTSVLIPIVFRLQDLRETTPKQ